MGKESLTLQDVKSTYSFWGNHPGLYGVGTWLTFLGHEKFLRSQTVCLLNLNKKDKMLDVACGTGRNFPHIQTAIKGGEIVGFDYSKEMLTAAENLAMRNRWENIRFIEGDAAELNIPDRNIDGAMSVLGISAVPGYESAIKRVREVLKEGGIFAVCDAKLFEGFWKVLNPVARLLYKKSAAWDPDNDIPGTMEKIFGNVKVKKYLGGAFYIAVSTK